MTHEVVSRKRKIQETVTDEEEFVTKKASNKEQSVTKEASDKEQRQHIINLCISKLSKRYKIVRTSNSSIKKSTLDKENQENPESEFKNGDQIKKQKLNISIRKHRKIAVGLSRSVLIENTLNRLKDVNKLEEQRKKEYLEFKRIPCNFARCVMIKNILSKYQNKVQLKEPSNESSAFFKLVLPRASPADYIYNSLSTPEPPELYNFEYFHIFMGMN